LLQAVIKMLVLPGAARGKSRRCKSAGRAHVLLARGAALHLSSGVANSKGFAENTFGAATTDGDGVPGVAVRSMVELSARAGGHSGETGGVSGGALARTDNGGEQGKLAAGEHPYGFAVLRSVTDERHRHGAAFLVEVYRLAHAKGAFLSWWWNGLTQSA
jgi:hypothetical protein